MSRLAVALDVSAVPASPAGAGLYILHLAESLARRSDELDLRLYCRRSDERRWRERAAGASVLAVAPDARPLRVAWGELALGPAVSSAAPPVALLHGPHYTMPLSSPVPVVVTVHDLTLREHPEWHQPTKVLVFRRALARAARHAALTVCVSEATRRRFCELYDPAGPVVTIPHGLDHERFRPDEPSPGADAEVLAGLGVAPPYVLHLGTHEPRKDLDSVLRAFEQLSAGSDVSLVLAGQEGWRTAALDAVLAANHRRITRLGYVDDHVVPALMRNAAAFVYPSFEEGFGLPVLEALACGAPVVTTEQSVMAEVADGAAALVPAGSPAELAGAIADTLAGGPAVAQRRARGLLVAARYTWEACAEAHLAAYRDVAERRPGGQ